MSIFVIIDNLNGYILNKDKVLYSACFNYDYKVCPKYQQKSAFLNQIYGNCNQFTANKMTDYLYANTMLHVRRNDTYLGHNTITRGPF